MLATALRGVLLADSTSACANGAFQLPIVGPPEIAGIFTNGRLLLPKSHGAHTIDCA
jgi:hypothetical protein